MESLPGSGEGQCYQVSIRCRKRVMLRRALNSKNLIACLLASGTGLVLYFHYPFPEDNLFLELLFLRARPVFLGAKFSYVLFLYTTPYIFYSILLSGLYIFAIKI